MKPHLANVTITDETTDVVLYTANPAAYIGIQNKRPDYVPAIDETVALALKILRRSDYPTLADFCCGTGSNTARIATELGTLKRAVLIDSNAEFLRTAGASHIRVDELRILCADIRKVDLREQLDVVLSVFAYHHMPDQDKLDYLRQVRSCLRSRGNLVLTEIYSPNADTTKKYYKALLRCIPLGERTAELETFLLQTAASTKFEFKVSRQCAHQQLKGSGFLLREAQKVWPTDTSLGEDVGTFVEHWEAT